MARKKRGYQPVEQPLLDIVNEICGVKMEFVKSVSHELDRYFDEAGAPIKINGYSETLFIWIEISDTTKDAELFELYNNLLTAFLLYDEENDSEFTWIVSFRNNGEILIVFEPGDSETDFNTFLYQRYS